MQVQEMSLNKIKLSKNSRLDIKSEELEGLMQSIKDSGLLQPIGVTKEGSDYEVIYGNRRFLACKKLGWRLIPAMVHETTKAVDNDIKNLAENIQRRNVSIAEAGRYMESMHKQGLSVAETAVRLGVSKSYVQSCLSAYQDVPKEFRNDIEIRVVNDRKRIPGKISVAVANAIVNAGKTHSLKVEEIKTLFKEAKSNDNFQKENIPRYVAAMKNGAKDPFNPAHNLTHIRVQFYMKAGYRDALMKKYIEKGHYKTFNALIVAILKGEKALKIDIGG